MRDWSRLLASDRLRPGSKPAAGDESNQFLSDYYRVVFASSFRRLQDKTQVSPLAVTDYVRRRLTHSVEVSVVGERMGRVIAHRLEKRINVPDSRDAVGKIVATACLLHDIGNPPFGHEGELAIRKWADRSGSRVVDHQCFDGNAQGFRVAVRLQHLGEPFGMNLTAATLATMLKYPRTPDSTDANNPDIGKRGKWSVMSSERSHYEAVANVVDLPLGIRHPLSYVVEAADDIVNRLVDIEDAIKIGLVGFPEVCDTIASVKAGSAPKLLDEMKQRRETISTGSAKERELWAYQYFRVRATAVLSAECEREFERSIDRLEGGTFDGDLIEKCDEAELYTKIKKLEYSKIFDDPEIVRVETGGKKAIVELLTIFADEVGANSKLARTVPVPPRIESDIDDELTCNLRRVVDYVSGMTDRYVIDLYQRLSGTSL